MSDSHHCKLLLNLIALVALSGIAGPNSANAQAAPVTSSQDNQEKLIYADCDSTYAIVLEANCQSASFIEPKTIAVYNETRQFWRKVRRYGVSSNSNNVVVIMRYETVVCPERKIAATQIKNFNRNGSLIGNSTEPLSFVLPNQQTPDQRNAVRFVCSIQ